jgi:hypothetical protein
MRLTLEFSPQNLPSPATAQVALNSYSRSESGLPLLTSDCTNMTELEIELRQIEKQIAEIRVDAKRKFVAAGISN